MRTVSWCPLRAPNAHGERRPGAWTVTHDTLDGERTLCGLKVPSLYDVFDIVPDWTGRSCKRCARLAS